MFGLFRNSSDHSRKRTQRGEERGEWCGISFNPENFIPGLIIGFVFGLLIDLTKLPRNPRKICAALGKKRGQQRLDSNGGSNGSDEELKMVLVVRQDLRMGPGKIASQCAHAATGMYAELMQRNRLKNTAESIGLPTFIVADAGRTEVVAGSKTVLAIGPGRKASVDSVTGKLRLL
ncbi:hypothetical protein C5167_019768 [Papaver somniferum]|uniref:peptidyl-tRNA hydrolase n=1 Tax=Papaver somniferum TaxID=3469 RepID=A0A4Y7IUG3_PAPSO|nr:hypothetical protein C5167_019768 [Papaver somniferum]